VVSTSIRDVISPYGERGLVYIADTVTEMMRACNAALREPVEFRRTRADAFLSGMSWDRTWSRTAALLDAATAPAAPQPPQTARAASGG
jgi:UDP-galactopyranose mutase